MTNINHRLAWIELNTALAKIHFKYDLKLKNPEFDWHSESGTRGMWRKPPLLVEVNPRSEMPVANGVLVK